jgi:hypothetical protein
MREPPPHGDFANRQMCKRLFWTLARETAWRAEAPPLRPVAIMAPLKRPRRQTTTYARAGLPRSVSGCEQSRASFPTRRPIDKEWNGGL